MLQEGVTPIELTPRSEQDIEKDAEKVYAKKDYQCKDYWNKLSFCVHPSIFYTFFIKLIRKRLSLPTVS